MVEQPLVPIWSQGMEHFFLQCSPCSLGLLAQETVLDWIWFSLSSLGSWGPETIKRQLFRKDQGALSPPGECFCRCELLAKGRLAPTVPAEQISLPLVVHPSFSPRANSSEAHRRLLEKQGHHSKGAGSGSVNSRGLLSPSSEGGSQIRCGNDWLCGDLSLGL